MNAKINGYTDTLNARRNGGEALDVEKVVEEIAGQAELTDLEAGVVLRFVFPPMSVPEGVHRIKVARGGTPEPAAADFLDAVIAESETAAPGFAAKVDDAYHRRVSDGVLRQLVESMDNPVRYSARVAWSDEDEAFVATVPELPGVSGIGPTASEAVREAHAAAQLAITVLREDGMPVPAPLPCGDPLTFLTAEHREEAELFPVGSAWRHYRAEGVYRVVGYAVFKGLNGNPADGTLCIRYTKGDGVEFVRPGESFSDSFLRIREGYLGNEGAELNRPTPEQRAAWLANPAAPSDSTRLTEIYVAGCYLEHALRERGRSEAKVEAACFLFGRRCFGREPWAVFDALLAEFDRRVSEEAP